MKPVTHRMGEVTRCGHTEFPQQTNNIYHIFATQQWDDLKITHQEATEIERSTQAQSTSKKWHEERKIRITASNFGRIIKRQAPITEKFLFNIFRAKPFIATSTSYGICHEKIAKQMYLKNTKMSTSIQ